MRKNTISPTRARVKGNILSDWDTLLTKTSFEDYHVTREKVEDVVWNNKSRKVLRLNAYAEPVYISTVVTPQDNQGRVILEPEGVATIEGIVTYLEATGGGYEDESVPYQPLTIYEDDKVIANLTTDEHGNFEYEYTGNSGEHIITIKSAHANGFNTGTHTIPITVKYVSQLVIDPIYEYELGYGEVKEFVATLLDNDRNPVADKPIVFQEGFRTLGTATTDSRGQARYFYTESSNRGSKTVLTLYHYPSRLYKNIKHRITGKLALVDGTPVTDMEVTLYSLWHSGARKWTNTDGNGEFMLEYTTEFAYDVPYYIAFKSRVEDTTDNEYEVYEPTWEFLGSIPYNEEIKYNNFYLDDITKWDWGKLSTTAVLDADIIDPTITNDGYLTTGRGNIVYYVPRIQTDLTEYMVKCKMMGTQLYNRIGFCQIIENNDDTLDASIALFQTADIIGQNMADDTVDHVLEFKFLDGVCYVFVDGTYTGLSENYNNANTNLHFAIYSNRKTGSSVYPIVVKEIGYTNCIDITRIPAVGESTITDNVYTVNRNENNTRGFDMTSRVYYNNDSMSSQTSATPSLTANGYLDCGVNLNMHHALPNKTRWIVNIKCEMNGNCKISYNNQVDGSITLERGSSGFKLYDSSSSYNSASSSGDFTSPQFKANTLSIIRNEDKITFKYYDVLGNLIEYTKTYTEHLSNGIISFNIADGTTPIFKLYSLTVQANNTTPKNKQLPVYNTDNWAFISRGTGSTEPVFSDEGILQVGKYMQHTYEQILDTNKKYTIYFYDPNPIENMHMGITGNNMNPSVKATVTSNGVITGINKATFTFENGSWNIAFNDNTPLLVSSRPNAKLCITTMNYNSSVQNKILAITEEEVSNDG